MRNSSLWLKWLGLAIAIAVILSFSLPATAQLDRNRCTFNGVPLYGKVQIVESFPDLKIQAVNSAPDLNVEFVKNFVNRCGQWQIVEGFPDFKVKFVQAFPDLTVKFVSDFSGIP